ncbi:DUF962 domain-containing protein [Croceimicrobium sp.]|uniref:Mpo1 family 2-hydroxy fatty acid dioxygenase n=1 Tax=Croceimicrobium sp. TaxID=2828340 RepID=UPI003BA85E80
MKSIQTWFDEYAVSHQNPTNKLIHFICVPSIFFSIVALLAAIPHGFLNSWAAEGWQPYLHFGTVLILFGLLFYLRLSFPLFIGIALFSALCLYLTKLLMLGPLPLWQSSLLIFAVAWIGQFIGHHIEGAKPSFLKDLQFLLIGPAWILGFIYRKFGLNY